MIIQLTGCGRLKDIQNEPENGQICIRFANGSAIGLSDISGKVQLGGGHHPSMGKNFPDLFIVGLDDIDTVLVVHLPQGEGKRAELLISTPEGGTQ